MVQLPATRCSCIAILWVSLVSFAATILRVASQRVFIVIVYFVIDSVRKLLDTPSYIPDVAFAICISLNSWYLFIADEKWWIFSSVLSFCARNKHLKNRHRAMYVCHWHIKLRISVHINLPSYFVKHARPETFGIGKFLCSDGWAPIFWKCG
jgi:hypothetical protein